MEGQETKGFLRETPMSRKKAIGTIGVFFGGQFVLGAFLAVLLVFGLGLGEDTANSWLNFLAFGTLALIFIGMHGRQFKKDWQRKGPFGLFLWKVFKGWLGLLALSVVANFIVFQLLGETAVAGNQYAIEVMTASYPVLMFITAVFFAPFVEEVVFRLAFMKWLEKRPWIGIIVSSLVFGFLHVAVTGDFIFLISYAAMGIPLGYSYYKTGNIWYPTAIHFVQNFYAMVMVLIVSNLY